MKLYEMIPDWNKMAGFPEDTVEKIKQEFAFLMDREFDDFNQVDFAANSEEWDFLDYLRESGGHWELYDRWIKLIGPAEGPDSDIRQKDRYNPIIDDWIAEKASYF